MVGKGGLTNSVLHNKLVEKKIKVIKEAFFNFNHSQFKTKNHERKITCLVQANTCHNRI